MKYWYLIFILFFIPSPVQSQNSKKSTSQNITLIDKYAYSTATEMYAIADTLPFNSDIFSLIVEITNEINAGVLIEDARVWDKLQKLEPYRMSYMVQEAVKSWVKKTVENISKRKNGFVYLSVMKSLCIEYKAGNFEKCIEYCRKGLRTMPSNYDVRNNMALALMHANKDLNSQIQLEIILQQNAQYLPAMVNLTVVYERLNRSKDAARISGEAYTINEQSKKDDPFFDPVLFNLSWYLNKESDYELADVVLNQSTTKPVSKKYQSFRVINSKQKTKQN